jgi:hypothetical protein
LFHTFISERDCTLLQCFYKGCTQSTQQLAVSLLMHSIHCCSAVFPYQALERRTAQETLIGCAGRIARNPKAPNIHSGKIVSENLGNYETSDLSASSIKPYERRISG